jgi:XTP/dITP diphosphohydrolase
MVKAMRLQEKARQVGFEWENREQVWEKVAEEIDELKSAVRDRDLGVSNEESADNGQETQMLNKKVEEELGDVFFSLVNYARFLQVDAENALEVTNKKFIKRFQLMEEQVKQAGKELSAMSLTEMDAIWNNIKKQH